MGIKHGDKEIAVHSMIVNRGCYPQIRIKHRNQVIVYTSGSWDLTHARHILFLTRCKAQGDILVVGVGSDFDIRHNRSDGRPINNEEVRLYHIDNLKPVDYCSLNSNLVVGLHPLKSESEALELLQPDIYAINDDAYDIPYRNVIAYKHNVKLVIGRREGNIPEFLKGISSTEIIKKLQGRR